MRTKTIVRGLKNSQSIRVLIQGIGFYTTIQSIQDDMVYGDQAAAILIAIERIAESKGEITGFGYTAPVSGYAVQVDLV